MPKDKKARIKKKMAEYKEVTIRQGADNKSPAPDPERAVAEQSMNFWMAQYDTFCEDEVGNPAWALVAEIARWLIKKYKSKEVWVIGHLAYDMIPNPLQANIVLVADNIPPAKYLEAVAAFTKILPYGFSLDLIRAEDANDDVKYDIKEFGWTYDKKHKEFYQPEPDESSYPPPTVNEEGHTIYHSRSPIIKYNCPADIEMKANWGDMSYMMNKFVPPAMREEYKKVGYHLSPETPEEYLGEVKNKKSKGKNEIKR